MRRTVELIRQDIEDVESARSEALRPPFYRRPNLERVAEYDRELERLHAEHDAVDLQGGVQ